MDCLRHYCIQLDFEASRWRFLDGAHLQAEELGQPFPLIRRGGCFFVRENLVGVRGSDSGIDTGCNFDGLLTVGLFKQWTNRAGGFSGGFSECARSPNGEFGGATYTNLELRMYPGNNVLGLSFLARHLVTLDFPKRTMYLKRVSVGPLPKDWPSTRAR
jgi:hypothetical protein